MSNAGEILKKFYAAVVKKDIAAARRYLNDDLLFLGLFETYHKAEEYIAALTKLLQVVVRLDVKEIIAEGNDVAVFFELETKAPSSSTRIIKWMQVFSFSVKGETLDAGYPRSRSRQRPGRWLSFHKWQHMTHKTSQGTVW
jgi:hypothetical protein